jgi:hypothetical protein
MDFVGRQIERVYVDETTSAADVLIAQILEKPGPLELRLALLLAARAGYSVGLEIGLAVAVADVAAGRQLRDWIARHVQEQDHLALEARDRQAANYLRVLR